MAEFKISGRMSVRRLKEDFKKAFGCSLRVYKNVNCRGAMADDAATLASIRAEGAKGGEFAVSGNKKVENFEKQFAEAWGIGVQVANADNTKLAPDDATISQASKM